MMIISDKRIIDAIVANTMNISGKIIMKNDYISPINLGNGYSIDLDISPYKYNYIYFKEDYKKSKNEVIGYIAFDVNTISKDTIGLILRRSVARQIHYDEHLGETATYGGENTSAKLVSILMDIPEFANWLIWNRL